MCLQAKVYVPCLYNYPISSPRFIRPFSLFYRLPNAELLRVKVSAYPCLYQVTRKLTSLVPKNSPTAQLLFLSFQALVNVTKMWMSGAKISLCPTHSVKTMVALASFALPVLPLAICNAKTGHNGYTDLACKIDSMSDRILGRIGEGVCPVTCQRR